MAGGWAMVALVWVAAAGCAAPRASPGRATTGATGLAPREPPCPGQRRGVVRWEGGGIGVDACGIVRRYGPETPARDRDERIEEMNAAMGR